MQFLARADRWASSCVMMDRDDLLWIDKVVRITAVVVAILALPIIFFVSIMASDAPGSAPYAKHLFATGVGIDLVGMGCAFVPAPNLPMSGKRLALFVLLRIPTYFVVVVGVGVFLLMLVKG
jgi:hypothetical protein